MSSFFSQNQIDKITEFALEAGKIAVSFFDSKDYFITRKKDNSQVTSADIAVSKFFHQKLAAEFPQIPIICEEGDLRDIKGDIFFAIDPIDGTTSFIDGKDQFAINIALIKDKKPIFGLIYAPLFEGGKLIFCNAKNQVILWHNINSNKQITVIDPSQNREINKPKIVATPRIKDVDLHNYVTQFYPAYEDNFTIYKLSSAVKFFYLLEGKANIYLHFRPSMEWDIAAGQALLELIGGKVKTVFLNQGQISLGKNMDYFKKDFLNQPFIADFKII